MAIAKAWTNQAFGLGKLCIANLGAETVQGVAEGLDPDGSLRLRLEDGQIRRITAALTGKTSLLVLSDEKGRKVIVPTDRLAYVEIGEPSSRRVGFGAL